MKNVLVVIFALIVGLVISFGFYSGIFYLLSLFLPFEFSFKIPVVFMLITVLIRTIIK